MLGDLLSSIEEPVRLDLPPVTYGPVKTSVGFITCLLRAGLEADCRRLGVMKVSTRTEEAVFELSTGEQVLITDRKITDRPEHIDGVLRQTDGGLRWQSHKLIDDLEAEAVRGGWPAAVRSRAAKWDGQFSFRREEPDERGFVEDGKRGLRPPQLGALHAVGAHWSLYRQPATIVMPTGTGKTETMLSVLTAYAREPLLVVVPSDALRSQTARKFISLGLLRFLGVLTPTVPNPIVGVLRKVPKNPPDLEIFDRCNVIVTTMTSIADGAAEPLWAEICNRVGAVVIDEAHHVGATRWAKFKEGFASKPVLQFTATPFRRDGALVEGQVIYSYPLRMAQADDYFRPITFEPVYEPNPSIADRSIAEVSISRLRADLAAGFDHLMMARCETIKRAEVVCGIYQALAPDLHPILIHSEQADRQARIDRLVRRECKIAVCVNMLGEGFDLPELKVAAIHDLHKSLAILLQFTGRFTRSAGKNIGDASVVANIAEPKVSVALERLYSEDADWNHLLSEMSSQAAQEHARLIQFLSESQRLDSRSDEDDAVVSDKLLRPTFSTLFFEAEEFKPKRFHEGLREGLEPYRVWLHERSSTLFFVTREEPSVKWARSKSVRDRVWSLFVLHFDASRNLLYLSSTDHSSTWEALAKAVGAKQMISGDTIFRAMGRINRLIFQNVGVRKHGRRNLSYASYTGAEVVGALGMAEKNGSIKAMLSGQGWEDGRQITIGCSAKGRVWSREQGTIPRFNDWAELVGDKLSDTSLDMSRLIDNVLLPTIVSKLPEAELLCIEWPLEMLRIAEERIVFRTASRAELSQITFELEIAGRDQSRNAIQFDLVEASGDAWGRFEFLLGGPNEFSVVQISGEEVFATVAKIEGTLASYFSDYPPLFRFIDLSELDANLHITPQNPYEMFVEDARFEPWDWTGVDLQAESMWKKGVARPNSVQSKVAQRYIDDEYDIVFDDDDSGEAADLVCFKLEANAIRLALVHCKFSGGKAAGERVKDVVEVSSQAVRSARWIGKFEALLHHLRGRNDPSKRAGRPSRFVHGTPAVLSQMGKVSRVMPVKTDILIVQPGLSKAARTADQSVVVAATVTYLKETVGLDLRFICSD